MVSARGYRLLFWLGLLVLIIVALGLVQSILLPFAAGFVIAYILAPGVAWLERRGVTRNLGSLIIVSLFLVAVAGILVVLVTLIQGQIVELIARVPSLVHSSQDLLGKLITLLQEQLPAEDVTKLRDVVSTKLAEALTWLAALVQGMIGSSFAVLNILSLVIVTPIVAFFLLRDWDIMVAQIDA